MARGGKEAGVVADVGLHEPIAIVGIAGRFPGGPGNSNHIDEFHQSLCSGEDPVTELPLDRWDIDEFYDPDRSAIGKVYVRNGAFIQGIQDFDASYFAISDMESYGMDAHQRLLL